MQQTPGQVPPERAPVAKKEPLPTSMRIRVGVVVVSSVVVALLTLPVAILGLTSDPPQTDGIWVLIVVGLVLPSVFLLLIARQVRRWRRDPSVRRRQLSEPTQRLLLVGNLVVLVIAQLVRGLSGLPFWPGLGLGLAVVLAGSTVVLWLAKRRDPRVRMWGRHRPPPADESDAPR